MSIFRNTGIVAILAIAIAATGAFAQEPTPVTPPDAAQPPPAVPAAPPAPAIPPAAVVPPAAPPAALEDCAACHGMAKDAPPSIGPNLWGVGGRKAGATDYAYSPAMKAYAVTWTPEALVAFLQNPQGAVPGTTMAYPGVSDPAAAKAVADYLMTLHDPT